MPLDSDPTAQLSKRRLLELGGLSFAERQVDVPVRREGHDRATLRNLHPLDELALAIYDVVDRPPLDRFRRDRADPDVALGIGASGVREERRLVVGQLTRRNEVELRWRHVRARRSRGAAALDTPGWWRTADRRTSGAHRDHHPLL